jgi:hypothetical protein
MKPELTMLNQENIKHMIHSIRGQQIMLDEDLAELYNVSTKALNQAVKRNAKRFPSNFMFQLDINEYDSLRSQIVTIKTERGKHRKYIPYAFTEQGVAMLSGVLKSDTAVTVSINIMNAFISMRKFISANAQVFQRLDTVETKLIDYDKKFDQVFKAIEDKDIKPEKGIFFDGQVFDAYAFVSDLIRSAEKSVVLIDNYIDDSVLTLLGKRGKNIKAKIFTKEISKQLSLDLEKYNSQYPSIEVKEFKLSHDRFLIIDNKTVYHFGASLKDLGKKWFAFSKFGKEAFCILNKLEIK